MFEVAAPQTKDELATALGVLSHELERYLESFSNEDFYAPQGGYWSPAQHVGHLSHAVLAVARGLRLPRPVISLMFGRAEGRSRSFSEMLELYRHKLAEGATAGRYSPDPKRRGRDDIMEQWHIAGKRINRALARWADRELDRYRLPHPILGKLTLREMLAFTVFHNAHHAGRIRERADPRGGLAPTETSALPRSANR
jgi:DinB superfamily